MKHKRSRPSLELSLFLATLILLSAATPASGSGFAPLMNSLQRFHGDKATWSFESGVLTGKASGKESPGGRVFTFERFGNFVPRFKARAGSGNSAVLPRSAVHPINSWRGTKSGSPPRMPVLRFSTLPISPRWPRPAPRRIRRAMK